MSDPAPGGHATAPEPRTATSFARPTFADRSRPWRIGLAVSGGVWAALTLPLVAYAFGSTAYAWIQRVPLYLRAWARANATIFDAYIIYGALASLAFLAIGLALLPDLRRAGLGGRIMAWLILLGAPVCALSYLNTPSSAPLHVLWGAEFFVLVAVGIAGAVAAWTAGSRWRPWVRVLLAITLVVLVAGTAAFGYWPHGTLIALAVEAVAVIAGAPRDARLAAVP